MDVFNLPREKVEVSSKRNVLVSSFEDDTEQRRIKNTRKAMTFRIISPALTLSQLEEYREFYDDHLGELSAFQFVSPMDGETYTVRFGGELKETLDRGLFRCEFSFKVVYE